MAHDADIFPPFEQAEPHILEILERGHRVEARLISGSDDQHAIAQYAALDRNTHRNQPVIRPGLRDEQADIHPAFMMLEHEDPVFPGHRRRSPQLIAAPACPRMLESRAQDAHFILVAIVGGADVALIDEGGGGRFGGRGGAGEQTHEQEETCAHGSRRHDQNTDVRPLWA